MFRTVTIKALIRNTLIAMNVRRRSDDEGLGEHLVATPSSGAVRFVDDGSESSDRLGPFDVNESRDDGSPYPHVSFDAGDLVLSVRARTIGARSIFSDAQKYRPLNCECNEQVHTHRRRMNASHHFDGRHERGRL